MSVAIDAIEGPPGAAARWSSIDWPAVRRHVSRLQARIVKAIKAHLVPGCFAAPYQGLSRVRSKSHARFLGEGEIVRSPPYPTVSRHLGDETHPCPPNGDLRPLLAIRAQQANGCFSVFLLRP